MSKKENNGFHQDVSERAIEIKIGLVLVEMETHFLERGGKFPLREVLPSKLQQRVI